MQTTSRLKGLEVTAEGTGAVSHAGVALLRALSDGSGLTAGLSKALASARLLIYDRGRVLADLGCAVADGAEVISDFRVMTDQAELFGLVASVPTAWRMLNEIASGGERVQARITRAVNAARRCAWAGIEARHGALPGVKIAGKVLEGVTCLRLDATVVTAHSDGKEGAEPNYKGFGLHPLGCWCDNTGEPLAGMLRPGSAGSNTTAGHLRVLEAAGLRRCGSSPAVNGRIPAPSCPCSRPPTAGGTPCGSPTCPSALPAGAASSPTSTQPTGSTHGLRTPSAPAKTPGSAEG